MCKILPNKPAPQLVDSTDMLALVCFLAKYQEDLNKLRYKIYAWKEEDGDLQDYIVGQWPVIQGTRNQMNLAKIGEMEFDHTRIPKAVASILANA